MKRITTATLLFTALFAASVAETASYEDKAMATGAVIGATTGAVIGSTSNKTAEGAVAGALLGTVAGAVIASQSEPTVVVQPPAPHKQVVRRHEHHLEKASYKHKKEFRHFEHNDHGKRD